VAGSGTALRLKGTDAIGVPAKVSDTKATKELMSAVPVSKVSRTENSPSVNPASLEPVVKVTGPEAGPKIVLGPIARPPSFKSVKNVTES